MIYHNLFVCLTSTCDIVVRLNLHVWTIDVSTHPLARMSDPKESCCWILLSNSVQVWYFLPLVQWNFNVRSKVVLNFE